MSQRSKAWRVKGVIAPAAMETSIGTGHTWSRPRHNMPKWHSMSNPWWELRYDNWPFYSDASIID
jgi:hypothetical protein